MAPSHISSTNHFNAHGEQGQFPKIVGISMVKNEQDVIEPFVRHNLRLLDRLIVLDNGSVDETSRILTALAQEFPNLVVLEDKRFGYTQSERMTSLLHQCQASFAADYVIPLDADEFVDSPDRTSFHQALERIPTGGYGLIPWCTFVLTPGSVDAATSDPPRTMVWRRCQELPSYHKAILHLGGAPATDILIEQGNHRARSISGQQIPVVRMSSLRLLHYPVRSRDQLIAKSVVGWMAYLAKDPRAVERGQGVHWHENFKRIANGQSIDPVALCEMSLLYAQSPRTFDWEADVVQENPQFNYKRRFSTGKCLGSTELIVRSWEQAVTGSPSVAPPVTAPGKDKLATNTPPTNTDSPAVLHADHAAGNLTGSTGKSVARFIQEGKPQEAVALLDVAINERETAELWNDWATVQHGCGHADKAERGYRRALDLDGSCRQPAVNLGLMLFAQGRLQEGIPFLDRHKNTLTVEEKQAIRELAARFQRQNEITAAKTDLQPARVSQPARASKTRRAFIDLGANVGKISFEYAKNNPDCDIYCVEPTRELIQEINEKSFQAGRTFITMWAAAWTYDGMINLFGSGAPEASTILGGKVEINGWPQIDYANSRLVPCFDFSAWLMRTFNLTDHVTVKMDIEGAEYDLLEHMIADRSILLVNELICEWHYDRYPNVPVERHNKIRNRVKELTSLKDWR